MLTVVSDMLDSTMFRNGLLIVGDAVVSGSIKGCGSFAHATSVITDSVPLSIGGRRPETDVLALRNDSRALDTK